MTAPAVPSGGDLEYEAAARRHAARRRLRAAIAYFVLALFVVGAVGPFLYLLSPAFRDSVSIFSYPPEWVPKSFYTGNFEFLFQETLYLRWALNTFIFASAVTVITLFISSLAGYAFARLSFPGKQVLFFAILATLMVPLAALLAPLYLTVKALGLLNTYPGLILPMIVTPLGVFMMRQFISTLPDGIYEAARLDGASEWQVYRRIVVPLIKPALVVLGIFVFMTQWVNFLWPLVAVTNDNMRTLTVGVAALEGQFVTNWGIIAAASLLTMVPITIVFLVFQRWFVRASLAGALKE
jgi:ABC-type glycerol-3-phosphate transport system permease component